MAVDLDKIIILTKKTTKHVQYRDSKAEIRGITTQESSQPIAYSGPMIGCHLLLGYQESRGLKFISHDNFMSSEPLERTLQYINSDIETGHYCLFLTAKSIEENLRREYQSPQDIQDCIDFLERCCYEGKIRFEKVYFIDDREFDKVEAKFTFRDNRLCVEGIVSSDSGGISISTYAVTVNFSLKSNPKKWTFDGHSLGFFGDGNILADIINNNDSFPSASCNIS